MTRSIELRRQLAAVIFTMIALMGAAVANAEEDLYDGKWHFSITPYLWLPDINGTVEYTNAGGGEQYFYGRRTEQLSRVARLRRHVHR